MLSALAELLHQGRFYKATSNFLSTVRPPSLPVSGSLSEIEEMELDENVQVWQKRIQQSRFRCTAEDLASDQKHWKRCAVVERMTAALSDVKSPFESKLRQEGAETLEDRLNKDDDMLSALAELLHQGRFYKATSNFLSTLHPQTTRQTPYTDLESLYDHWRDRFYGGSLNAFLENIFRYEAEWSASNHYSRTVSIVQSSGTGKSRLVDEIGKEFLSVSFALRLQGETGYPPGDLEVTNYLRSPKADSDIHGSVVGLLAGVIEHGKPPQQFHLLHKINGQSLELMRENHLVIVTEWYTKYSGDHPNASRREIAREWHDLMAPVKIEDKDHVSAAPGRLPDTRSRFRREFCRKIMKTANLMRDDLGAQPKWVREMQDSKAIISFFATFPVGC